MVSIICFCRNAASTIGRCIDSILGQDYPNLQVIVQDGASDDGTLEILQSYGERLELVSEADNSAGEAMFRALARIEGEFFGSCLADEQLLPHAVSWAVTRLQQRPDAGAIYGDHYIMDIHGLITGLVKPEPWIFQRFLCSEIMPPFCASFFRSKCFKQLGLTGYTGCGEFELWLQLGARFPVYHVPGTVAKYGVHPDQLSFQVKSLAGQAEARKAALERLFNDSEIGESYAWSRSSALAGVNTWLVNCYCNCQAWEMALEAFYRAAVLETSKERARRAGLRLVRHGINLAKKGDMENACRFLKLPMDFSQLFPDLKPLAAGFGLNLTAATA